MIDKILEKLIEVKEEITSSSMYNSESQKTTGMIDEAIELVNNLDIPVVSNSLPHFDCGMRVKTFDREDGEWVKGEVFGNHNNKVTVKWEDLSEPVEHEQDEWSRFVRL